MKFTQRQLLIVLGGVVVVGVLIFVVGANLRSSSRPPEIALTVWGIFDEGDKFEQVTSYYERLRPNVKVDYRRVDRSSYERVLLDALATGEGPDVFMIHNRALPKEKNKLVPAPSTQLGLARFRELFPTVAEQDFVSGGEVYALPLFMDALTLLYNKNMFDQAGIVRPPANWNEFQEVIPHLRTSNQAGQILRAASAIGGTTRTVHAGTDLLELLMMQNGTPMTDEGFTRALFSSGGSGKPGLRALNFYLQFANTASPYYTWNESQPQSLEAFAGEKVATIFGYQRDLLALKKKSPFLSVGASLMPQPSGSSRRIDYADYWGFAVSKQAQFPMWAWDFVITVAGTPDGANVYTGLEGRLPALRSLIAEKFEDPDVGAFAREALTARSWYQADAKRIEEIFNTALASVLSGQIDSSRALRQAEEQVSQLMGR